MQQSDRVSQQPGMESRLSPECEDGTMSCVGPGSAHLQACLPDPTGGALTSPWGWGVCGDGGRICYCGANRG